LKDTRELRIRIQMALAQAPQLAKVVLSLLTDWESWYTLLRDKVTALQVWEFVDPDKNTPQPEWPEEPNVSDIKKSATQLKDLITDNDQSYLNLYKVTLSK
jgi:hypothetical protein